MALTSDLLAPAVASSVHKPQRRIVFEDSAVSIRAALGAGARVIGMATTLEAEALRRDFPLEAVTRDYTEVEAGALVKYLGKQQSW